MINLYAKTDGKIWFGVACDEKQVFATSFGFSQASVLQSLLESIPFGVPFQYSEGTSPFAEHALNLVKNVYYGKEIVVAVPLAMEHLSKYAQSVIKIVSLIPIGYAASYGSVAKVSGGSPRAVGRIMARNPFAPIIPCHRVVCSDMTLGGYGGGLNVKLDLLKREKRGYTDRRELLVKGKKFELFPVEFILKRVTK
jgi:methylated-DNA-[protein]-cysteine S-methyltransferase